ncbi:MULTISPECIES: glycoside hydrolase family 15 protein [Paraburkholderia]|uniref:glycoside hydrolase family 15 protein n=1 Tax=Paraburkholderia TaxID=1822464 RepID=UPI00035E222B|nr:MULTISPECIES: glycoside hydrolase family 15 protein [Paraburkholderia]MDH6147937.1 glucoamylase [Paraburkholderia sp. WSM4179]
MAYLLESNPAPGAPGNPLNWSRADKDAVGTAYSLSSQVWYTTAGGILTEIYFPDVDTPQVRDFQLIITDGSTFYHDAQKDFDHRCEWPEPPALSFRLTSQAKGQPYTVVQDVIAEKGSACVLVRTTLQGDQDFLNKLHVYALLAPHMAGYGAGNTAHRVSTANGDRLVATRDHYWLALGADCGFGTTSCGFVGVNDGWTDIIANRRLPVWNYDAAKDGYVAVTAEINRAGQNQFVLALAFCVDEPTPITQSTPNKALTAVSEALAYPFDTHADPYSHKQAFNQGWNDAVRDPFEPKANITGDGNALFNMSRNVLLAHEDKTADGALVASLSIPWGQTMRDLAAGYHMVWPRDMCQSALALLASGAQDAPLRGLMFLAASQLADGSFPQKFFIDGEPWPGNASQLDEYSFPIILAYHLSEAGLLRQFDPTGMVLAAAGALIKNGPMTQQERWEELEGYSPSTLASNIAALVCAAAKWADAKTAQFLLEYADFLESHLETWCVTTQGTLVPDIAQHYIRILPTHINGVFDFPEDPNTAKVSVWRNEYDANTIVDAGFLELVRYGIRAANDPIIVNSIKVVDAVIRKNLPQGPGFYRYNHDGYGQGNLGEDWYDGSPFGVGRPWPLLAGERGHYELAAGGDPTPYIRALEAFAGTRGLLPEQVWDLPDLPNTPFVTGGPTGSATPLAWAHAEYIKLVRSASDGHVFDRLDVVAGRYQPRLAQAPRARSTIEIWNFNRPLPSIPAATTLRIPLAAPFRLRWSIDDWASSEDSEATTTAVGIYYVDLVTQAAQAGSSLAFTFFWTSSQTWQGQNFSVALQS